MTLGLGALAAGCTKRSAADHDDHDHHDDNDSTSTTLAADDLDTTHILELDDDHYHSRSAVPHRASQPAEARSAGRALAPRDRSSVRSRW